MNHTVLVVRHASRSRFARAASLFAFASASFVLSACNSTVGEASDKRDVLQAQLEAIGREPIDVHAVLAAIEPTLACNEEPNWTVVKLTLEGALPPNPSFSFASFWAAIEATVVKRNDLKPAQKKERLRAQVVALLSSADEDNRLYWRAKGHSLSVATPPPIATTQPAIPATQPAPATTQPVQPATRPALAAARSFALEIDPQSARDALMSKYILRIQDYHEANYGDLFRTSAWVGLQLDSAVVIASALATAFTPASTKTALAAAATIFGGVRLAASRNVLNEKAASTVLNAMIAQRTTALATLTAGMKQPISAYGVDQALVDLVTYFNVGGIDKALAQIEKSTSEAQKKADDALEKARSETRGSFQAVATGSPKTGATLRFDPNVSLGTLTVKEILVGGRVLDTDVYDVSKVNDAGNPISFVSQDVRLDGQLVIISGATEKAGQFVGTIEWK